LSAPLGIWVVQGDVELPEVWLRELPTEFILLDGTVRLREDVDLTGLDLRRSAHGDALSRPSDDRLHIVMGHRPDFALGNVDADLLLAGHTHGGQVQLPFIGPIVTLSGIPRAWAAGRTEIDGDTTLIVSRGVGMERGLAPRLRFLCRPELVLIEVDR
jgi:predicted MPP superfamily phosphohydrolase